MAQLVHCDSVSLAQPLQHHFPLNRAASNRETLDRSTQASMPKRLLAQRLIELPPACRMLLEALASTDSNRDAALRVLLHCCNINLQLATQCNKLGLLQRLLQLASSAALSNLSRVRQGSFVTHR